MCRTHNRAFTKAPARYPYGLLTDFQPVPYSSVQEQRLRVMRSALTTSLLLLHAQDGSAFYPIGTKQPYHDLPADAYGVDGLIDEAAAADAQAAALTAQACGSGHSLVIVVARHGARYPTKRKMAAVMALAQLVADHEGAAPEALAWSQHALQVCVSCRTCCCICTPQW